MSVPKLASLVDLAARVEIDVEEDLADVILQDVSAVVRAYCGQTWLDDDGDLTAVPAEVVAVVCQMAARVYGSPADQSGVQQESLGGYSYTVGSAAASGAAGLLAAEKAVLDRYRVRVRQIQLGSWL